MSSSLKAAFTSLVLLMLSAGLQAADKAGHYGVGQLATPAQIKGWDIDVRPDGAGLPEGSGSVLDGEVLYEAQCAECHGSFGEGEGRHPILAGGIGSLTADRPTRSVGSYWPYVSTLWDYIHRAMPFTAPESLTDDEVYAVTAYVLYLNDLVEDDFELNRATYHDVILPNQGQFYPDDRPDVANVRCMTDCLTGALLVHSESPGFRPAMADSSTASLEAAPKAMPKLTAGKSTYDQLCAICHKSGIGGAPKLGDAKDWANRLQKGHAAVLANAINGYVGEQGVMPAKGGFSHLSDEAVTAAVDYMLKELQ